jgi:hypothetical protein
MSDDYVEEHEQVIHIILEEEIPGHDRRVESELFHKNKRLLVHEHDLACFNPSCGSRENREVHHWAEWCGEAWYDMDKLKRFLMGHDVYGFSKMYADRPIESVDDIRNLVVLCSRCHREDPFAIHHAPFPQHIQQAIVKDGHSFIGLKDHLTKHHDKD